MFQSGQILQGQASWGMLPRGGSCDPPETSHSKIQVFFVQNSHLMGCPAACLFVVNLAILLQLGTLTHVCHFVPCHGMIGWRIVKSACVTFPLGVWL